MDFFPSEPLAYIVGELAAFAASKGRGFGGGGTSGGPWWGGGLGTLSGLKRSDVQLIYRQTCLKDSSIQDPVM